MPKPDADVRRGSRIERAAWMKQVRWRLYDFVYDQCQDLKIIDEACDTIAQNIVDHLREFAQARAKRTGKRPGGVGRK